MTEPVTIQWLIENWKKALDRFEQESPNDDYGYCACLSNCIQDLSALSPQSNEQVVEEIMEYMFKDYKDSSEWFSVIPNIVRKALERFIPQNKVDSVEIKAKFDKQWYTECPNCCADVLKFHKYCRNCWKIKRVQVNK